MTGRTAQFRPERDVLNQNGAEVAALSVALLLNLCGTTQAQTQAFENFRLWYGVTIEGEFESATRKVAFLNTFLRDGYVLRYTGSGS